MIKFTTRIHEAASDDATRPVLTHVKVEDGFAWATDSYVLAKAPVEHDEDGLIPAAAAKKAWVSTGQSTVSHPVSFENGGWFVKSPKLQTGFDRGVGPDATFPDCPNLLNGVVERLACAEGAITIGVNAENLLRAARAVCKGKSAAILLTVDPLVADKARPMLVAPLGGDGDALAIVMPMRRS